MADPVNTHRITPSGGYRKLLLTLHIVTSVGWLGSVAAFLSLAIAGVISRNETLVCASYLDMNIIGRFVIIPLACLSLVIGILQALNSKWGLTKYYWVLVKFGLTVFAAAVLLMKVRIMEQLANAAELGQIMNVSLHHEKAEMIVHSGGGLIVLAFITALSIYKPWGKTRFVRSLISTSGPPSLS